MMLCGHVYGRPVIKPLPWLQERNNAKYTCFYNETNALLSDFHQHKHLQWVVHITILPELLARIQIIFSTIDVVRETTCSITRHYSCKTTTELKEITFIDFQIDAQNSYLFIYNIFIKILYMFWALPCSSSGGLRRNCIYAACGIVTLCRWLSCAPVKKEVLS
jgi:hypothetical protein